MNLFGYVIEVLAIFIFISAFRHARRKDFLDDHGTVNGKKYAANMRMVAVGSRLVLAVVLLVVGLWMVGAFR
jgi:hypothetical protein